MESALEVPVSNHLDQSSSSRSESAKTSGLYVCYVCSKMFSKKFSLKQHLEIHCGENPFKCEVCSKAFQRKYNLTRHMACHEKKHLHFCGHCGHGFSREDNLRCHLKNMDNHSCAECGEIFCTKFKLKDHIDEKHASSSEVREASYPNPYSDQVKHHKRKNALEVFSTATFDCCEDYELDILAFLNSLVSSIENELKYQLHEKKGFKWSLMLEVFLTPTFQEDLCECLTLCMNSNTVPILNEDEVSECIDTAFGEIMTAFEEFFEFELFWTFTKIKKLNVLTAKYNPF